MKNLEQLKDEKMHEYRTKGYDLMSSALLAEAYFLELDLGYVSTDMPFDELYQLFDNEVKRKAVELFENMPIDGLLSYR